MVDLEQQQRAVHLHSGRLNQQRTPEQLNTPLRENTYPLLVENAMLEANDGVFLAQAQAIN